MLSTIPAIRRRLGGDAHENDEIGDSASWLSWVAISDREFVASLSYNRPPLHWVVFFGAWSENSAAHSPRLAVAGSQLPQLMDLNFHSANT